MKTIQLSGIIEKFYDGFSKIKLVQQDGYKIDLVGRFQEISESFPRRMIQVNYWVSDEACTKSELVEKLIKRLYGIVDAAYETNSYNYSELTSGTDFDTVLRIGGHDLFIELSSKEGKFLLIEININ